MYILCRNTIDNKYSDYILILNLKIYGKLCTHNLHKQIFKLN